MRILKENLDDCKGNEFVVRVVPPFEAETRSEATEIIRKELGHPKSKLKTTVRDVIELLEPFETDATVEIEEGDLIVIENGTRFRVDIENELIKEA